MVEAIVFDLDETLAVPDRDRATILEDVTAATGTPPISRESYLDAHRQHLTRKTREPIFAELLAGRETDTDAEELTTAYRRTIAESLAPISGVESLLAELKDTYSVGLLTNGPVRAQRDKLETLGWERTFDAALVTGELEAGKPDPRAFGAILSELDVDAASAVYVGDDVEADIAGATNAGMDAIQILKPDGPDPDDRALAHLEQHSIARELPAVLGRLER
ncbi:HAD family hydrolase [Halostagnicola larsenii XH-48]|uniref:HAD family hydrolase n=1 Tax=Halostagnicola larsenii XH-48 TaxID=797299 RepID=W0JM90_9EURY|nr:HAD family hydrolase [Halostagnicola larsenii]AHF99820.1 HAD family hydrolase [Halostagnicola larsenii XH-48]